MSWQVNSDINKKPEAIKTQNDYHTEIHQHYFILCGLKWDLTFFGLGVVRIVYRIHQRMNSCGHHTSTAILFIAVRGYWQSRKYIMCILDVEKLCVPVGRVRQPFYKTSLCRFLHSSLTMNPQDCLKFINWKAFDLKKSYMLQFQTHLMHIEPQVLFRNL